MRIASCFVPLAPKLYPSFQEESIEFEQKLRRYFFHTLSSHGFNYSFPTSWFIPWFLSDPRGTSPLQCRWGAVTPEPEQPKTTERRMRGRGVSKLHSDGDGRPPEVQEAKQDAWAAKKHGMVQGLPSDHFMYGKSTVC